MENNLDNAEQVSVYTDLQVQPEQAAQQVQSDQPNLQQAPESLLSSYQATMKRNFESAFPNQSAPQQAKRSRSNSFSPSHESFLRDSQATIKRDFESAFPNPSPYQQAKRSRSNSTERAPQRSNYNDTIERDGTNIVAAFANDENAATTGDNICGSQGAEQADPTQTLETTVAIDPQETPAVMTNPSGGDTVFHADEVSHPDAISHADEVSRADTTERLIEKSRDEIRKHLVLVKRHSATSGLDRETASILVEEVLLQISANGLKLSEIASLGSALLPSGGGAPTSSVKLEVDLPETDKPKAVYRGFSSSPLSDPPSSFDDLSLLRSLSPALIMPIPAAIPAPPAVGAECESRPTQTELTISDDKDMSTQTEPAAQKKYEDGLAQTEPMPASAKTGKNSTEAIGARSNNPTDETLWERELESIRRPEPLVAGEYTMVNTPLREPVKVVSAANGTGGGHRATPQSKPSGNSLRICGGLPSSSSGGQSYENCDVISLADSSEEDKKGHHHHHHHPPPRRSSYLVGGGSVMYGPDGAHMIPSDSEDEEEFRGRWPLRPELKPAAPCDDDIDDLPDYEDSEDGHGGAAAPAEQGGLGFGFRGQPVDPIGRAQNDAIDYGYEANTESEASGSVKKEAPASAHEKNFAITYESVIGGRARRASGMVRARSRSRSPLRCRRADAGSYRDNRGYHRSYTQGRSLPSLEFKNPSDGVGRRYLRDEPESGSFYGYSGNARSTGEIERALRYQDRFNDVGEIPGPKSGLRLKLDSYIRDVAINAGAVGLERDINRVVEETFYAGETLDEEQAMKRNWTRERTKLYKGFPLVEKIGFVATDNHTKPEGDCYWRALAYSLHGTPSRWDIVKAEHYAYFKHVLGDKTHPRHDLYARLNTQFFATCGPIPRDGKFPTTHKFKANLWQLLHIPHCWTPSVMQQITADLYNIHLVTFTYDRRKNVCTEVSIRGAYNSRHVFMLFESNNHFQPLAVNEYLS
ncbi:hypothetical protein SAMD00023353_5700440 [Rosellinia necatrix]|uniref:OTU domain-containing protein n=1 Tax=Rosellinia necatrix TaxID=77044 RepID=A0A1W2TTR2_ROSNE|nr:hypothetical protein SAMD00023353_5700440 [Rosellinia necatrix]